MTNLYSQIPKELSKYYSFVNAAELQLVDSAYKCASMSYDSAFKYMPTPLAKDLFNASICTSALMQYDKTFDLLSQLLQKGYKFENIAELHEFSEFLKSKWGRKLIDNSRDNYSYNSKIRDAIDSIYFMDQQFRTASGGYGKYLDTICKIDSSNMAALNLILSEYGYPGEDLYGIGESLNHQNIESIIIHLSNGSQCYFHDYSSVLKEAFLEGRISSQTLAYLLYRNTAQDQYGIQYSSLCRYVLDTAKIEGKDLNYYESLSKNISYGFLPIDSAQQEQINRNRATIGLPTIQEDRKKALFTLKNSTFTFPSYSKHTYFISDIETYDKVIKNLIIPDYALEY